MSTLSRYVFKEMLGPTALGFAFYTSIIAMRVLFELAGMIIRRSLSWGAVGKMLLYSLPNIVVLTLPMSLLFGILIAVGRLSADSEIIAIRALGISMRKVYRPVFLFSFAIFLATFYLINFVMPRGNANVQALRAELTAASAERVVKPRVFHTEYENLMIYVNDVDPTTGQWKGVFVADNTADPTPERATPAEFAQEAADGPSDEEAIGGLAHQGSGQRVIVADRGSISLQRPSNDIWMNLLGAETHVWDPSKPDRYDRTDSATQRILLPTRSRGGTVDQNAVTRTFREMNLNELVAQERTLSRSRWASDRYNRNVALVEIHKKFSIPFACITFGILGLPLGITNRRGGKSSGFSLSIAIIVAYYLMITNGEELASSGKIPPWLGMWAANILLLGLGIYLLSRANRDAVAHRGEGGIFARMFQGIRGVFARRSRKSMARPVASEGSVLTRLDFTFPNIIDRYILREFLKILSLVLVSVTALFVIVEYTEMARDVRQNSVAASTLLRYFRFQIFMLLNWSLPISVLVATLVTFGVLAKNNEITAIKSGGVSLYRISAPIMAVAVVISLVAYLILDFVLPYANERVYEIKQRIEGREAVTATSHQKLWYLSKGRYLINFLAYDAEAKRLNQVQVFEFHPSEFRLTRRVYADRATWNGQAWAFESGWIRSFTDDGASTFTNITEPLALFYPETPEDFDTKITPPDQMTYAQLRRYIATLRESGYAADELAVRLYQKTSWPALSIVMALIAMPFAFKIGRKGALYGIGLALVLGIVYWMVFAIFAKFGEVGNLPPLLAAWSANVLFALAAAYMFLHVDT
jgi:LPS export ABC transporter permease LptG